LKMPVAEAIAPLQLVDRTVLEGMGPPTVGFNARSELPTDPTALSGDETPHRGVASPPSAKLTPWLRPDPSSSIAAPNRNLPTTIR